MARFSAYVHQAKEYFEAVRATQPVAKPLIAYYFVLNLTKAYLTAVDPTTTSGKLYHGVVPDPVDSQRYRFTQEWFKVKDDGVFRLLAERTGQGFCWPSGQRIQMKRIMSYLPEASDLYADAYGQHPRLIPTTEVSVLFGSVDGKKHGWLRVEVSRNALEQRKLGPERLLSASRIFGDRFALVADDDKPDSASYESQRSFPYHRRSDVLPELAQLYDSTLFATQRYRRGRPTYVVESMRSELLSHEAVTFAVMHHLSEMVRYRPERVEQLVGGKHYWILAPWVDRACENFLLAMASRTALEEHIVD
jgi:hypothetical protein